MARRHTQRSTAAAARTYIKARALRPDPYRSFEPNHHPRIMETGDDSDKPPNHGVIIIKEKCVPTLNPKICLGSSFKGGGRGLYARERIAKNEWVWREEKGDEFAAIARTVEEIMALPEDARRTFFHFAYCECGHRWGLFRYFFFFGFASRASMCALTHAATRGARPPCALRR
jgi:hypothetical protein